MKKAIYDCRKARVKELRMKERTHHQQDCPNPFCFAYQGNAEGLSSATGDIKKHAETEWMWSGRGVSARCVGVQVRVRVMSSTRRSTFRRVLCESSASSA